MKKIDYKQGFLILLIVTLVAILLTSCQPADVASQQISKLADNFEVTRRIVFYNGITDTYMLTIEGKCSLGNADSTGELSVTCKTGPNEFKKHYLGLSDNVTYFVEQIDSIGADTYHYMVIFRPSVIIPSITID